MALKVRTLVAVALGSLAALGCSKDDSRLRGLTAGITKDSALAFIGENTPERPPAYFINGQLIEAIMLRREDAEGPPDSLSHQQITPVIMINGKLAGWGWKYWDSVAGANNITQ